MTTRFCKHCNSEHPFTDDFWSFGKRVVCRAHDKARCAKYRSKNPEKRKETVRQSALLHRDTKKQYWLRVKEVEGSKRKEKYKEDLTLQKAARARSLAWRKDNPVRYRETKRNYERFKEKNDPSFRLKKRLRTRLYQALKGSHKTGSAVQSLGMDIETFKSWFAEKFQDGMSWDNWGEWHIDHIKPLSSFDLSNPEQIAIACHHTNLQPLWGEENIEKSDKLDWVRL